MRRWNRTVMEWNCFLGLETDIPVTDMPGVNKCVHTVRSLRVTSLPKANQALVETVIDRGCISPTIQRHSVIHRLKQLGGDLDKSTILYGAEPFDRSFRIVYILPSGERFCDWAIDWVGRFISIFAIDDKEKYRQAGFEITQQTFVFHKGKWVNFAWWIREVKGKLPQLYPCEEIVLDAVLA